MRVFHTNPASTSRVHNCSFEFQNRNECIPHGYKTMDKINLLKFEFQSRTNGLLRNANRILAHSSTSSLNSRIGMINFYTVDYVLYRPQSCMFEFQFRNDDLSDWLPEAHCFVHSLCLNSRYETINFQTLLQEESTSFQRGVHPHHVSYRFHY